MVVKPGKYIPWTDIVLYGGLAVVSVGAAVWAGLTPQEWNVGKIVALIAVPVAFVALALIVILGKLFSRPDYHTKQGVAVWSVNGRPNKHQMDAAFELLIDTLPGLYKDPGAITSLMLEHLVKGVKVEWRDKPLTVFSRYGWAVKDKAGLQQGKAIMVHWQGSITDSAFYHEMGHMIRQEVLCKPIDYKHEDTDWWTMMAAINNHARKDERIQGDKVVIML